MFVCLFAGNHFLIIRLFFFFSYRQLFSPCINVKIIYIFYLLSSSRRPFEGCCKLLTDEGKAALLPLCEAIMQWVFRQFFFSTSFFYCFLFLFYFFNFFFSFQFYSYENILKFLALASWSLCVLFSCHVGRRRRKYVNFRCYSVQSSTAFSLNFFFFDKNLFFPKTKTKKKNPSFLFFFFNRHISSNNVAELHSKDFDIVSDLLQCVRCVR